MALTDADGNLIDSHLLPGPAQDLRGTTVLIERLTCAHMLADRALERIAFNLTEIERDPRQTSRWECCVSLAIR